MNQTPRFDGGLLIGLDAARGMPVQIASSATTAVVGASGSGRTTILSTRAARLATLGFRIAIVAPYWPSSGWFRGDDGRSLRMGPGSTWHYDPIALHGRLPDERAEDLRPLFAALLGSEFDELADDLLRAALLDFYQTEDHVGMAGLISSLMLMERPMTVLAARRRDDLADRLDAITARGPLARYFTPPFDELPGEEIRRLLIHPESTANADERALLACMTLLAATDVLANGLGPGALLVDDLDSLIDAAQQSVDDTLSNFLRLGRRADLSLSMGLALSATTRPGWRLPHVLALASSWVFLPGDEDLIRGWARATPHQIDPHELTLALAGDERPAALVQDGQITRLRTIVLPGEEDVLAGYL